MGGGARACLWVCLCEGGRAGGGGRYVCMKGGCMSARGGRGFYIGRGCVGGCGDEVGCV